MYEKPEHSLTTLISAAAVLSGSESKTTQSPDVATVLKSRLTRAYEILQEDDHVDFIGAGLKTLQYITANASLRLLERVQSLLDPQDSTPSDSGPTPPLLGTRDLVHVRTLLSIIFKWAVVPLVSELELTRPGPRPPASGEPRIIDLTERELDFEDLPLIIMRLFALLFGFGLSSSIRQTWITTSIIGQHAVDMLTPCLIIGWAPEPVSDPFALCSKNVKVLSMRFITVLRPHEAIAALGTVLSTIASKRSSFPYVPKVCGFLLSNQLKRPDGVRGLCTAVFGEDVEDAEVAPLDKLEHISKVLSTVPGSSNPQDYYQFIIPRILALLVPSSSQQGSPSHKRAAAFALSRMLSASFQHHVTTSAILLPLLHVPLLSLSPIVDDKMTAAQPTLHLTAVESMKTLQTFLLHMDPSPMELSMLLTPIVPELYTLVSLHRSSKTVDPNVRESLNALLSTWGRIVSSSDAVDGIWRITTGFGGNWESGLDGFTRSTKPAPPPSISLLAAAELEASSSDDVDINANPFNLRPDPSEFVAFLKVLDRRDVSSDIFLKLLNEYRELKESKEQPMRTLLYLQLILQIQAQLSETVLSKPEHVLSFTKHALSSEPLASSGVGDKSISKKGLGLNDLRIVDSASDAGDSDDEEESEGTDRTAEPGGGKDEIVETSVTLLLSILEANPDLSPHNTSDLNDILTSLNHLISQGSPTIRQLAREARLVLTARTASTSSAASASCSTAEREPVQATYQKALKLLQDPIIPVRAHGLQLLRELVSPPTGARNSAQACQDKPQLDSALMPGILSIFIQSIQDDESYIFLNAVQGLAAMVDGHGKEVLRGLVDVYLSGTGVGGSGVAGAGGTAMSKEELDARVRVGEVLNTVVKRCGGALGLYVDILIPPLLTIVRSSHLPTTLRTSTFSILAQCVGANALALSSYTANLVDTCLELIQLESVAAKSTSMYSKEPSFSASRSAATGDGPGNDQHGVKPSIRQADLMDLEPTTKVTKAAPLRRSALHLLSQLLHSHIQNLYESRSSLVSLPKATLSVGGLQIKGLSISEEAIPEALLKRANVVLSYVAATDEDAVTRVMAGEASELVDQYKGASLGF